MFKNILIVVAKQPAPGQTKTRLSPPLTPEQASALYECFLQDTLDQMRMVDETQRLIAYLPQNAQNYFLRLAPDFELALQNGHDLGERLDNALTGCLSKGYERAVIMDSDSPTLPPAFLSQAFNVLADGADVALGPCEDGGYYLIGIKKPAPRLLRGVRMSTATVTADTIAIAKEEGLNVSLLPTWYDVDDGTGLIRLMKEMNGLDTQVAIRTRKFLEQNSIRKLLFGKYKKCQASQ